MKHETKFVYLDLIRGISALVVLVFHVRILFFFRQFDMEPAQWAAQLAAIPVWAKAFYLLTSYGHEAVIVFFVLSGFFISRSIYEAYLDGRWSIAEYALSRLSRLWTVLFPALLLTWLLDVIGSGMFPNSFSYQGTINLVAGGESVLALSAKEFWGNFVFLNGLTVRHFGTNGPLWSLPFEFWYYVCFPLLFFLLCRHYSWRARGIAALLLFSVAAWISRHNLEIIQYAPIWLMGVAAMFAVRNQRLVAFFKKRWVTALVWSALPGVLVAIRLDKHPHVGTLIGFALFYTLGFVMLLLILSLAGRSASKTTGKIAHALSSVSFSIYVFHTPIACFMAAWLVPLKRTLTPESLLLFLATALFVFAASVACWFCSERYTGAVKRGMRSLASRIGIAPAIQVQR